MFEDHISSPSSGFGDCPAAVCLKFPNMFGPPGRNAGEFIARGLFSVDSTSDVRVATTEHEIDKVAFRAFAHRGVAHKTQELKGDEVEDVADPGVVERFFRSHYDFLKS